MNSYPTTVFTATIITRKTIWQVKGETVGEEQVKLAISGKTFPTNILVTKNLVLPVIIRMGFLKRHRRLNFAQQQVEVTYPGNTKIKNDIFPFASNEKENQNNCCSRIQSSIQPRRDTYW